MGYDVNRFVKCNDINIDLICNICRGVLEEGVWVPDCEHSFCRECINNWLSRRNVCPNDRQYLSLTQLKTIPRFMRNILDKLEIKCDFIGNGCPQVVTLESLRQHVSVCDFNPEKRVECVSGCGLIIKKADLESHNCVQALRQRVNNLIEDNMKCERTVSEVRHDLTSLRNDNKRINNLLDCLQKDVNRLLVDKQSSVSTECEGTSVPQTSLSTTSLSAAGKYNERNTRLVPNPYVLITPLHQSLGSSDEPSSSTFIGSANRLTGDEPPYKRRTTLRMATPSPSSRPLSTTISSSLMHSYSPPSATYSSAHEDSFISTPPSASPRFISNVTTISPSTDSLSPDEEATTAVTLSDNLNESYNYISLDVDQESGTDHEDDSETLEQVNEYDIDIVSNE